jgi:hypothetical protein
MSVKNVTMIDLALIELARGDASAPREVFKTLSAKGFVKLVGGTPKLTAEGSARAKKLSGLEHDLRLMFCGSSAGQPLKMIGGSVLHS